MDAEADSLTRAPDFALARAQLPLPSPDAAPEPPREPSDGQQPWSDQPRRIPRLAEMPAREDVLGWLTAVHQDSRVLKRLPAVRQCPPSSPQT
jgi:hypothetical protein